MDPGQREWDVAIVGAGMGGATLGHALVLRGHRVLFLERGAKEFAPLAGATPTESEDPEERISAGYWPRKITATVDGRTSRFFAPMGCGVGGSTLLYAGTLERFERSDFMPSAAEQHGGSAWPLRFQEFLPYYEKAEHLFRVRGTADPLNEDDARSLLEPVPLNEFDTSLANSFREVGLHPYYQHRGMKEVEACDQCPGRVCHRACKSDARTICVEPALNSGNCDVMDRCEVTRLEADRNRVQHLICVRDGRELAVRAKLVVLSAGAYLSPKLLLASRNEHWPQGVGNDHDQVGRHIMFHLMDMLAIWPKGRVKTSKPSKTIGLRDFYRHDGVRLGTLQSMGLSADYGSIVFAWRRKLQRSRWSSSRTAWHLIRIPAFAASMILGSAGIFATIVEDMAYAGNRVVLDAAEPSGIRVEYRVSDELRKRGRLMRQLLKQRLSGFRSLFLNGELELNFGHPCGSCRFGVDPRTSVLDPSNRVHGMDNLYVVDASFMPSSAGVNPSLTIAANALRVADIIHQRLRPVAPEPA